MNEKQILAQHILTQVASILPVLREPNFQLDIRTLEFHKYPSLQKTTSILKIDLKDGDDIYIQLSLKSEPAVVSVETTTEANNTEPAGAICLACNAQVVKHPGDTCAECLIDAGGGT